MYKIFQENLNWFLQNYQENEFNTHILFMYMYVDGYAQKKASASFCAPKSFQNSTICSIRQFNIFRMTDCLQNSYNIFSLVLWSLFFQYDARATTYIELCKLSLKNYTRINLFKTKKSKIVVSKKILKLNERYFLLQWTFFGITYIFKHVCIHSLSFHVSRMCINITFSKMIFMTHYNIIRYSISYTHLISKMNLVW